LTVDLDLALIGNGRIGALVDAKASIVWGCFPRFDGDPVFCALLDTAVPGDARGIWSVELVDGTEITQSYAENTAVLVTRMIDRTGGVVEISDFAPRFVHHGRLHQPMTIARRIRRLTGSPRVTVRLRPAFQYGRARPMMTTGSHHIRYIGPDLTLRLTTDASITAILEERPFFVEDTVTMLLGGDETIPEQLAELGRSFVEGTLEHWRDWVRSLAIPFQWQSAVIRAAITLLNAFDDTGAIVADDHVPEAPAPAQLGLSLLLAARRLFRRQCAKPPGCVNTMERYLNTWSASRPRRGQRSDSAVYRISGCRGSTGTRDALPGYRGMGPVRVGNDAWRQIQHDVYGSRCSLRPVFFDERRPIVATSRCSNSSSARPASHRDA
jgi:GH15 family glucan-1,4-alpha-glucosidase